MKVQKGIAAELCGRTTVDKTVAWAKGVVLPQRRASTRLRASGGRLAVARRVLRLEAGHLALQHLSKEIGVGRWRKGVVRVDVRPTKAVLMQVGVGLASVT